MSSHNGPYEPLRIKAQLDHAVIDSDGHYTEFMPVLAGRFTFDYPQEFFAGVNPDFFKGTRVEPYLLETV